MYHSNFSPREKEKFTELDEDNYAEVCEEAPVYETPYYGSFQVASKPSILPTFSKKCNFSVSSLNKNNETAEKLRNKEEQKRLKKHEARKLVISCPVPSSFVHKTHAFKNSDGLTIEGMEVKAVQELIKQVKAPQMTEDKARVVRSHSDSEKLPNGSRKNTELDNSGQKGSENVPMLPGNTLNEIKNRAFVPPKPSKALGEIPIPPISSQTQWKPIKEEQIPSQNGYLRLNGSEVLLNTNQKPAISPKIESISSKVLMNTPLGVENSSPRPLMTPKIEPNCPKPWMNTENVQKNIPMSPKPLILPAISPKVMPNSSNFLTKPTVAEKNFSPQPISTKLLFSTNNGVEKSQNMTPKPNIQPKVNILTKSQPLIKPEISPKIVPNLPNLKPEPPKNKPATVFKPNLPQTAGLKHINPQVSVTNSHKAPNKPVIFQRIQPNPDIDLAETLRKVVLNRSTAYHHDSESEEEEGDYFATQ